MLKQTYRQAWELYIQYSHWTWQIETELYCNGLLVLQHGEFLRRPHYDGCHNDHSGMIDFLLSLHNSCGVAFVSRDQLAQTNPGNIPKI